jgi:hypothetical protein
LILHDPLWITFSTSGFGDLVTHRNACRYLNDKDLFERFYKQHLSKRLLSSRVASYEMEHLMLSKLKAECGYQFTSKLESMFTDMRTSVDTMTAFKTHVKENNLDLGVDLSVQVSLFLFPSELFVLQLPMHCNVL